MAGACGNGQVVFAHVIEKRLEWRDYEVSKLFMLFEDYQLFTSGDSDRSKDDQPAQRHKRGLGEAGVPRQDHPGKPPHNHHHQLFHQHIITNTRITIHPNIQLNPQASLSHGHLVVATTSQCYVYTTKNWNTPIIFDLKEGSVSLLLQANKHFLLVESQAIYIYSYEGRMVCSPKWSGMRPEALSRLSTDSAPQP